MRRTPRQIRKSLAVTVLPAMQQQRDNSRRNIDKIRGQGTWFMDRLLPALETLIHANSQEGVHETRKGGEGCCTRKDLPPRTAQRMVRTAKKAAVSIFVYMSESRRIGYSFGLKKSDEGQRSASGRSGVHGALFSSLLPAALHDAVHHPAASSEHTKRPCKNMDHFSLFLKGSRPLQGRGRKHRGRTVCAADVENRERQEGRI